ncbi:DsbE family thiol:disulfide interchange protein [Sphingomonas histidinilytica]|jgi:cytochrome c biogenesis protein CcmG/thiol:disulfide interchange protein DsbE|uniref:Cytochrome c biogenesis protein CcmG, thiol:disulfide interchange protein DsbE n=1 Tax=Rhizorhabdus histidinilytica TaxID=439228 RepID=A0A1T5B3N4_9SPHN|nr:DsbE family thiol:disulfide interchange protein [Rhizorhabdus histidinilytica]MBO9379744.1 DsbE family thiol:disulfide interchange protein [Rhizorhabdus histidinilytica]QEH79407.1 DsbE family thiol:disulfide interchange protein [Sphingomonas sp. C8-2]SKB41805.1 cytochrome c biogenesis protein CcmG, thiol:disulfide interchange protein DsbE [Rhizorhabdus histidinilytica]
MRKLLIWLPLALFLIFLGVFASGLISPESKTIPSKLVGKPMPGFALAPAVPGKPGLTSAELANGRPHLVNVFASWCVPCIAEAPQLRQLAEAGVPVYGIAIRDRPEDLARFLARNGDPFRAIGGDPNSSVQIALGSSGVPETFIVDGKGIIRKQHIGAINPEDVPGIMSALGDAR